MAKDYYNLAPDAKFRDMILAIRADESIHREMNHYFCELDPNDKVEHFEISLLEREIEKIDISDSARNA